MFLEGDHILVVNRNASGRGKTRERRVKNTANRKQKHLKISHLEAVRTRFKKAQEPNYATIIAVARKISKKILQEGPWLLM